MTTPGTIEQTRSELEHAPEIPSKNLPPVPYKDLPETPPLRKIIGPSVILVTGFATRVMAWVTTPRGSFRR